MASTHDFHPNEAFAHRLGFIVMLLSAAFIITLAPNHLAGRSGTQSRNLFLCGTPDMTGSESTGEEPTLDCREHGPKPALNALGAPVAAVGYVAGDQNRNGAFMLAGGDHFVFLPIVLRKGNSTPVETPTPIATSTPGATPTPTSTPSPTSNQPTLLKAYLIRGPQPAYAVVKYRPRQFVAGLDADPGDGVARIDNPGPYNGWDILNTPNVGINTTFDEDNWIQLTLNRSAIVAITWRGGSSLPGWLKSWSKSADVIINGDSTPTYRRNVAAGNLQLGSVYDPNAPSRTPRDTYLILLAEGNGAPSTAPTVPAGLEVPQPNATCPKWVHDQYVALGPDGKYYPTWHPQIDPVYWCYFHHEHGSDPSPHKPLFGYSATQEGMTEGHEGFKVYKFDAPNNVVAIVTHHFGTGNAVKAACVRFHTFDMAIYKSGVLVADIHLMADHGKSVHIGPYVDTDLHPTACPNQAAEADADKSYGERKFQVTSYQPVVDYEPWVMDFAKVIVGELDVFAVNTPSRITDCNTLDCDVNVSTGDQGEFRFVSYGSTFGIQAGARTGEFFTDAKGQKFINSGEAGAVRQYVAPGAKILLPPLANDQTECYITHPFGGSYVCQEDSPLDRDMNIENSLQSPN